MILFPADYEPMSNLSFCDLLYSSVLVIFFLVAVVVVFVVVVNNNEKISYQGHYQIHVHFQLCYIFSHCSCSLVLLYAPSFS